MEENRYIRDLNMVIKVFKEPFQTMFPGSKVGCTCILIKDIITIHYFYIFMLNSSHILHINILV